MGQENITIETGRGYDYWGLQSPHKGSRVKFPWEVNLAGLLDLREAPAEPKASQGTPKKPETPPADPMEQARAFAPHVDDAATMAVVTLMVAEAIDVSFEAAARGVEALNVAVHGLARHS